MNKKIAFGSALWGSFTFILGAATALYVASREMEYLEANPQISLPEVAPEFPVIYFFSAVIVIGIVLFLIPVSKLKWVFKVLFALVFAWGVFVVLALSLPSWILVAILAVVASLAWLFRPSIWLQDLLLLISVVGLGAIFGILLSPWSIMIFIAIVAVYDYLAVRFGYMVWMAKKLSQSDSLPAFIIPKTRNNWNLNLKTKGSQNIIEGEPSEKEYSILGGGDIGFPLILIVSVLVTYGFFSSLIIAVFSLAGLISAFVIQGLFLKGKPMPALPPIALASLIGLLIIHFAM
jgi:presenilin-like A22 family membrane protease